MPKCAQNKFDAFVVVEPVTEESVYVSWDDSWNSWLTPCKADFRNTVQQPMRYMFALKNCNLPVLKIPRGLLLEPADLISKIWLYN